MTSIRNILSLMAAIPTQTLAPASTTSPTPPPATNPRECGEVNVFYTGFPPHHPLTIAQSWDPVRVEVGLRNETVNLVKAGYNVHVVWAGTEIPISVLEDRMDQNGMTYDIAAIGYGMRGATLEPIVERFEDLVEMYERKAPSARKVFNYNPESLLWSVSHRMPMKENCEAVGKPGKLIGYEEICDSRCDIKSGSVHAEL